MHKSDQLDDGASVDATRAESAQERRKGKLFCRSPIERLAGWRWKAIGRAKCLSLLTAKVACQAVNTIGSRGKD